MQKIDREGKKTEDHVAIDQLPLAYPPYIYPQF